MPDAPLKPEPSRRCQRAASLGAALGAGVAFALGLPEACSPGPEAIGRGLAVLPAAGLAVGAAVAAARAALAGRLPAFALACAAAVGLWAAGGRSQARGLGRTLAGRAGPGGAWRARLAGAGPQVLVLAAEAGLIGALGAASASAIPLAGLLGRWAAVVVAYGSLPAPGDERAAALVRAVEFREFALASVSAMAIALAALDAVGVVLLAVAAALALIVRVGSHARRGGVDTDAMRAAAALVEVATLAVCAGLVAAVASP